MFLQDWALVFADNLDENPCTIRKISWFSHSFIKPKNCLSVQQQELRRLCGSFQRLEVERPVGRPEQQQHPEQSRQPRRKKIAANAENSFHTSRSSDRFDLSVFEKQKTNSCLCFKAVLSNPVAIRHMRRQSV